MKYQVNYALITWASSGGKVSRTKRNVNADSAEQAKEKIMKLTRGKAFNIICRSLEDG